MPRRRAYKLSLAVFLVLTVPSIVLIGVGLRYDDSPWEMPVLTMWLPGFTLLVPFWVPSLLAGITTVILWHRSRIIPPGHCKACRYDLTGNVSGVCPECGTSKGDD